MSPASLRRYRAERLLREQFRSLRVSVIASARGSLRARGAELDESDMEACYAQAWQGLYAAMLGGQRILNPAGWLTAVTFRRAIDEHRSRARAGLRDRPGHLAQDARDGTRGAGGPGDASVQRDIASQLDERRKLRDLFEALRLQLSVREQQAATLCYLQGLSRSQAARTMGVSEARMRKLMEGTAPGHPGVAAKVTALLDTIHKGEWCAEQGSLMRGLAYGILDPDGERHRLALIHTSACPACRAYVASLRGLAALLPPVPSLLPLLLAGGAGAKATGLGAALGRGAVPACGGPSTGAASGGAGAGAAAHGTGAGGGLFGTGAITPGAAASGAAGAGAAGGGWLLAGAGVSAKLAAGCLLALGVGAGCAVLGTSHGSATRQSRVPARARAERASQGSASAAVPLAEVGRRAGSGPGAAGSAPAIARPVRPAGATSRASREFGPEQAGASSRSEPARAPGSPAAPTAVAAASARGADEFAPEASPSTSSASAARDGAVTRSSGEVSAAQREFSPG